MLPLLALLVIWEVVVRAFDVSPRVFPSIAPVFNAGVEAIRDGTLIRHIGASLGRIALGVRAQPRRRELGVLVELLRFALRLSDDHLGAAAGVAQSRLFDLQRALGGRLVGPLVMASP